LIGIDCPEIEKNVRWKKQIKRIGNGKLVIALGKKAKRYVEKLLKPGTKVRLELDIEQRDILGRLLAYVWLPDGRMLNESLLEKGYATLLTMPPNVKYLERFEKAYNKANKRRNKTKFKM
jgi:micrococcal nuclease